MSRLSDWVEKHAGISKSAQRGIMKGAGLAANFIPGIGPLASVGIGAAAGGLSGGGVGGAVMGGLTNYGIGKLAGLGASPVAPAAPAVPGAAAAPAAAAAAPTVAPVAAKSGLAGIGNWVAQHPGEAAMIGASAADLYTAWQQGKISDEERRRALDISERLTPGFQDLMSRVRAFQPEPVRY